MSIYDFEVQYRSKKEFSLSDLRGNVMLIVNTASKCGLTPQFKGLEWLHRTYKDQGLRVLGFPCNQFANQDPESDQAIRGFCQQNYGVSFPMFGKIEVNGGNAHPLYGHLKDEARGFLWTKRVKWNFTKFLVDHEGNVVKRYAPSTKPQKLVEDIEAQLAVIAVA